MKVVERVLGRRFCRIVYVDEMQFCFMPERGTIDTVFIVRRMRGERHAKGKTLYVYFVNLEKAFTEYQGKCWNGH